MCTFEIIYYVIIYNIYLPAKLFILHSNSVCNKINDSNQKRHINREYNSTLLLGAIAQFTLSMGGNVYDDVDDLHFKATFDVQCQQDHP